jgi:glycosyltransferase involved in cell wall biosynthesis
MTLSARAKKIGEELERGALVRCRHLIYPCDWARLSAIEDYGFPANAITVLPFGPNIDPEIIEHFRSIKRAEFSDGLTILFVAADWKRKGIGIVLEVQSQLRNRGINCKLLLVGNAHPDLQQTEGITNYGRLDKNKKDQLLTLCSLYEMAHLFVLPTTAEAFGMVFSEAQAFGCPSLTYAVGGTTTAVVHDKTGITLPLHARATDFADAVVELISEPDRYESMSIECRRRYEAEANWGTWADAVMAIATQVKGG